MNNGEKDNHWLTQAVTIRRLWWVFAFVLAVTVLAQLVFPVKGYFGVDGWFGFAAGFGFLACVLMVLFAKVLGKFLKRDQNYYKDESSDV